MESPELMQYGVGGGLCYLLLKLILDFLTNLRKNNSDCVQQDQWSAFLIQFSQQLTIIESLNKIIGDQTLIFTRLSATLEAQGTALNQISLDLRAGRK